MPDIFNAADNKELVIRLERLSPEATPLWGKMTVSQMLLHCQKPLDVATGRLALKSGIIGWLFGKMAKKSFLKNLGFGKNSPTAPQFKIAETPDFTREKKTLMDLVLEFGHKGPAVIINKKHPFFGQMTDEEWGQLQYIHLDHHLKQFGQ
ncbi:hypothetical protein HYN48_03315 [Flavobacterium magnum]|uniref:DUF1569 domain-containing protein n=1 Tax=Flavobacterium magnum TaxID=2162713 RepID=A0A2S0RBW7_9FLAO|nr:DUF1569 domain-containing protein [Flavobacterium magnum]AWA29193.1 hypothetical protein HYN48_03315 [Flavobacterium magnum]